MIGQLNGLYFIKQPAKFRSCFDLSGLKSSPLYLNPHIIIIHILLPSFSYFVLHVTEQCCFSSDLRPTCSIEHGPFIQVEKTVLLCILATQKANLTAKSYLWKLHVYQERWSAFCCSGLWLVSEDFKAWTTWISAKSFIYTNEWKSSLNFDQYISFSNFSYCLPCNSYCYKLIGSSNNPLTDIFLYSHNLSA